MKRSIRIGTRGSALAVWQADYVKTRLEERYPETEVSEVLMTTKGDKILDAPLAKIGGKGLFTKELEQAMLEGEIDLAVHSLKDMPTALPEGLVLAAVTRRADPGDALVSEHFAHFRDLPQGARVGTSSLRRRAQLLHARPDLEIVNLRGNVHTRLRKMKEQGLDAAVFAVAGLKRLGLADCIREVLPQSLMLPAVGQGALAVETRAEDAELRSLLAFLNDEATAACARAERAFLARVEGGCQVPVGVYAAPVHGKEMLHVEAVIASLDGKRLYRGEVAGLPEEAASLGRKLADELLEAGGLEIMHELGLLLDRH